MIHKEAFENPRLVAQAAFLRMQITDIINNTEDPIATRKEGGEPQMERQTRPIDVRGVYRTPSAHIDVQTPEDLAKAGIHISTEAISATWGPEAVTIYQAAKRQRLDNNRK